jgi:uncharacterized membrane protein YhaH (DUF805 family)
MSWIALLFSPEGRINRLHFWLGWLILFGAGFVLFWIPFFGHIVILLSLYCHICVYAKRLHDMGRSGWLQIVPFLIGFALPIAGLIMGGTDIFAHLHEFDSGGGFWVLLRAFGWLAAGLGGACLAWGAFLLWIGLSGSQPGDNRFGPPAPTTLI